MPSTMNLTGERRGSSAGGCTASGLCDLDNSSITSGTLYYYLPSLGCGKPGARSIPLSNALIRLDFCVPPAPWSQPVVPLFRHFASDKPGDRRNVFQFSWNPGTDGTFSSFPVFLALSSYRNPVNVP